MDKKPSWPPHDGLNPPAVETVRNIMLASKDGDKFKVLLSSKTPDEWKKIGAPREHVLDVFADLLPFYCWHRDSAVMAGRMLEVIGTSAFATYAYGKGTETDEWSEEPARRAIDRALKKWQERGRPYYVGAACIKWASCFKKGNRPKPRVIGNTKAILDYKGISCRMNLLSREIELQGAGLDGRNFEDAITLLCSMASEYGDEVTEATMRSHIMALAAGKSYSPAADYFRACAAEYQRSGDTTDYIRKAFDCIELNPDFKQDPEFCYLLFRKWAVSVAAMTLNLEGKYGCDGILILQGKGGVGKTEFCKNILPRREWYHSMSKFDPADRDSLDEATTHVIQEFAEFGETMKLKNVNTMKDFITRSTDAYRLPYAHRKREYPRLTSFIGTINEPMFLKDPTGNRRYWCIAVNHIHAYGDDNHLPDPAKLWGQATALFLGGESYHLDREDREKLAFMQRNVENWTDEMIILRDSLDFLADVSMWHDVTATELMHELGDVGRKTTARGIAAAIRRLKESFDERIKVPTSNHYWRFFVPPLKGDIGYGDTEIPNERTKWSKGR